MCVKAREAVGIKQSGNSLGMALEIMPPARARHEPWALGRRYLQPQLVTPPPTPMQTWHTYTPGQFPNTISINSPTMNRPRVFIMVPLGTNSSRGQHETVFATWAQHNIHGPSSSPRPATMSSMSTSDARCWPPPQAPCQHRIPHPRVLRVLFLARARPVDLQPPVFHTPVVCTASSSDHMRDPLRSFESWGNERERT